MGHTEVWPLFSDQGMGSRSSSWAARSPKFARPAAPNLRGGHPAGGLGIYQSILSNAVLINKMQTDFKTHRIQRSTLVPHSEILQWVRLGQRLERLSICWTNRILIKAWEASTTEHQLTLDTIPTFHTDLSGRTQNQRLLGKRQHLTSECYCHTDQDLNKLPAHCYELGKVFPTSGQPREGSNE